MRRRVAAPIAVLVICGLLLGVALWFGGRKQRLIADIQARGGQVQVYKSSDPPLLRFVARMLHDAGDDVFLDGPRFDDDWLADHDHLEVLRLNEVVARYCELTPQSFRSLLLRHRLMSFCVPGCSVTDEEVKLLAHHDDLIHLNLEHTAVGDAGLVAAKPQRLLFVMLGETNVSPAGLAAFRNSPTLRGIGLDGRQLTDETVAVLQTCSGLIHVRLIGPDVNDDRLLSLAIVPGLTNVELDRTQVTAEGIEALKAALPTCGVRLVAEEERFYDPARSGTD